MPRTRIGTQIDTQVSLVKNSKTFPVFYCNHTSKEVFLSSGKTGLILLLAMLKEGRWLNTDELEIMREFPEELRVVYNEVVF